MRITDSDNCKDVINKDIERKQKKAEDIWASMFSTLLSITPHDLSDMFIMDYPEMISPDCDENENE